MTPARPCRPRAKLPARALHCRPPPPPPLHSPGGSRGAFLAPTGASGRQGPGRAGVGDRSGWVPAAPGAASQKFEPQVRAELELPLAGPGGPARPPPRCPLNPTPPTPPVNCSPTRAGPCALAKRAALSGSPGRGAEEGTRAPGVSRAQGRAGASGAGAPQGVQGGGAGPAGAPRAGSPCVVCQLSPPMNILLREEQRHKGPA